jgi:ribose transport system permease protein
MNVSLDRKKNFLIIFVLACLAIGVSILINGWFTTWTALQVPTLSPFFADMRTVQGSLLSNQLGSDPQANNLGDPWARTMDYPKIWIWIAKLFQLNNETNFVLFICLYILAYIACCFLLLRDSPSLYILLAIFSGSSLLAVERGNNDLLAFALIFVGIILSQSYFNAFSILLATVLKIFPVLLVLTLVKKPKILVLLILIIAAYFLFNFGELKIIQAGNTALSDPNSMFASYGFDTNIRIIQQIVMGQSAFTYVLLKYLLILVSLVLAATLSRSKYLDLTGNSPYKTDLFIAGGIIFSGTYLITSNWDYRLIFLLICIPYILSVQNSYVKHSILIGILLSSNVSILGDYFGQSGVNLCTISKYYLFIMVTACLVKEYGNYLSGISPASGKACLMRMNEKLKSLAARSVSHLSRVQPGSSSNGLLRIAVLVLLLVAFSCLAHNFFSVSGALNLLLQTSPFIILAIGETVVLVVGCIDFSIGAMIVFGGAAVVLFNGLGMSFWEKMIDACLVCGVIGLANGFLVARARLPSFIVTFAMAIAIPGIAGVFKETMGALAGPGALVYQSIEQLPVEFRIISHDASGAEIVLFPGISWLVIIMVVMAILSHLFLAKTRYGRYLYLVGSNPAASLFSGINVVRIQILAFVFSSMMAGLTGIMLATYSGAPIEYSAGYGYEMIAIECAMIGGATITGGAGSIMGTVIGSLIIGTLTMGLTMMNVNHLQLPMFLNALVLIGAVYLAQRQKGR